MDRKKRQEISSFGKILPETCNQGGMYTSICEPIVRGLHNGFDGAVFAYGQAGGGKTYSMIGADGSMEGSGRGVVPRACEQVFEGLNPGDVVRISCWEIIGKDIIDLLAYDEATGQCRKMEGREDRHLAGLQRSVVGSSGEAQRVFEDASRHRKTRFIPGRDGASSRSHAAFVIQVENDNGTSASLHLVDLQGSERMTIHGDGSEGMTETPLINSALLELGKVMQLLGNKEKRSSDVYFDSSIYRNDTLTWALRKALGGNTQTALLLTASPHDQQYYATMNTVEFGERCKRVRRTLTASQMRASLESKCECSGELQELRERIALADAEVWIPHEEI